jgi:phenylacetate-coenzyme A ligase PaaK-like adenylate-forming protein
MFAVPREQVARIHASSGTTGKPTVVGYTQGDIDRWADLVARSIRAAGGRPATWCTWPTATACSPAAWARTTAPSGWAAP